VGEITRRFRPTLNPGFLKRGVKRINRRDKLFRAADLIP